MSGWELPLEGQMVTQCRIDFAFSVLYLNEYHVRIECPFVFDGSDGESHDLDPGGDPRSMAPVLSIARGEGATGRAANDGSLRLTFSDGSQITVPADDDYEAWTLTGPRALRLVSLPGGGLAVREPDPASGTPPSSSPGRSRG